MLILRTVLCLTLLLACWKWGDIKNWEKYYSTILYMIVNNLLYRFIIDGKYFLWKLENEHFVLNHTFSFLVQTFLIFPCIVILFLSHLPKSKKKLIIHLIISATILVGIETVMYISGMITYHHGWNYLWSIAFNFIIVIMLWFHFLKPIPAWLVSFLFTAFFISYFHVPFPKH
jgi:hypothetical protein